MEKYLAQDNQLFKDILERNYFEKCRKGEYDIEIILNGLCKANCEYCYMKKHQKDLFPAELYNPSQIIHNTQLLINWYIENQFTCPIGIFSGEWLTTELREPIFEMFYNSFKDVPKTLRPSRITIADNMLFINDDFITQEVQIYIDLLDTIGIPVCFSASIDGKYCEYGRTEQQDDFYIKVFNFLHHNNGVAHPMISSHNIKDWIQNYNWWYENAPFNITEQLMMLEVRDETWTTESITQLLEYCQFLLEFKLHNMFNDNLEAFAKYLLIPDGHYSPERITFNEFNKGFDKIRCSFTHAFVVRAADLAIPLCHRTMYKNLILGNFVVENDKIIDIENGNPSLAILKTHTKISCLPHCENCQIQGICTTFCCGNSYENFRNLLVPVKPVCDMYKAKYSFLIMAYDKLGIFDIIEKKGDTFMDPMYRQYMLDLRSNILK